MTIGCIIQARMGSKRLPGKVMKKIDNSHTLLDFQMEQLKNCNKIDKVVIATTTKSEDNVIYEYCQQLGLDVFRGSENDVLDRYYRCAEKYNFSVIVRITSDNPLIDPDIVDSIITEFSKKSVDYLSNVIMRTFPYGTEAEVFSFMALEKAWKKSHKPYDREHVTPYIYTNPQIFKILNFENKQDQSNFKWTVDTEYDLQKVKSIVSQIKNRPIKMQDIITVYPKLKFD